MRDATKHDRFWFKTPKGNGNSAGRLEATTVTLANLTTTMKRSVVILLGCCLGLTAAFRSTPLSVARKTSFLAAPATPSPRSTSKSSRTTGLHMFMGSDGGLLGVGTPEVVSLDTRRVTFLSSVLPTFWATKIKPPADDSAPVSHFLHHFLLY